MSYLGYNISHIGSKYLIDIIYYIHIQENLSCENLNRDIFPYISAKYKTRIHNVRKNIARATDNMYYNCETNRLKEYINCKQETKPKLKNIINTTLEKINSERFRSIEE